MVKCQPTKVTTWDYQKNKLCELLYLKQGEDAISHIAFHSEKYEEQLFSITEAMMLNTFVNTEKKYTELQSKFRLEGTSGHQNPHNYSKLR